jgi:uncharacterized protein (DUF58 family)
VNALFRLYDFYFVRHRALTAASVIFVVALVCGFATGFWLLFRLAYVVVVAVPLSYLWARLNLWGLDVTVERRVDRLQEGQSTEDRITVRNRSWVYKLWLEVDDPSDLPGRAVKRVIALGPWRSRSWRVSTVCTRRGLYSLGPPTVTTGDPFGLFRLTRRFGYRQRILVYPRAIELPNFYVPPANLPGEGRFRRRTHYVTPNASGVRQYQYGDSFNRIHWPTTARTNELMVKLFELDPASDIWVILDLEEKVHAGSGENSTEEYAVRIAASVARYFLMANRSVGYLGLGGTFDLEEAERGAQHYMRILEHLALARAGGESPLADLLTAESRRFGRHTTVVVVTPSTSEDWVLNLQSLAQRGVKVAAILLEPSTFGSAENSLLVFGSLAAGDVYTYLVKRSDDLVQALGSGIDSRQMRTAWKAGVQP